MPANKVNEDRLYRSLDRLLPHKEELEKHLKNRLGELFDLDYDLLLYDVTSTYFEGEAKRNELAQRGYSRDHRPDCKQVNIALVVSREGMPLGYQLFTGNRNDGTTLEEIVERIERLYGRANRIWVLDRGMVSEENVRFLKEAKRRYIVRTPKGMLKRFEGELRAKDWNQVREGLEVRLCPAPGGEEVFLLCRSAHRKEKEQAMHERFAKRIEEGLEKIVASCGKRKQLPAAVGQRVGRLLGKNSRAAGAFEVKIDPDTDGFAKCQWKRIDRWREWARLSEGCYVLRSNVTDWSPEELWRAYMQLTEAEAAFRIQKTDLQLRPIWHQKQERVGSAHPGVLSGLCVVEDAGTTLPTRWVGQRTTKSIPGVGGHHHGRRRVTDAQRSNHPQALHQSTDRASGDSVATPESTSPQLAENGPSVVKSRACPC